MIVPLSKNGEHRKKHKKILLSSCLFFFVKKPQSRFRQIIKKAVYKNLCIRISENYETLGATKRLAFGKSGTNFFTVF